MGESLYAILGVDEDADQDAIKTAYRDRAKRQHPDVSDATDATRQFKRLTLARDTLLDEDERARYDKLGHDTYIHQHDRTDLFDVAGDRQADTEFASSTAVSAARTVADGYGGDTDWWRERAGPEPESAETTTPQAQSRSSPGASWAHSEPTDWTDTTRRDRSDRSFIRAAGIWLVVHAMLLCSAVATAFVLSTSVGPAMTGPAVVAGILVVVASATASTLHLVSVVYT